jgi:urease accessory protein
MTTEAALAPGARLDWLPQETILFDRCRLRRRLTVDMAEDAIFLGVETLVLGRALMGERIEAGFVKDDVRITRGSDLVFADAIALDGAISDQMAAAWCGGPANCLASVTYVAPDAEARLNTLRALIPANAGVSLIRDGVLFARVLAADSHDLRRALIPVLTALRGPLPPTWTL